MSTTAFMLPASSPKRTYSPSPFRALVSRRYSNKHHHQTEQWALIYMGLILAKAAAMLVMINATGFPAPVSDRASMKSHARISANLALAYL